MVLLHGAALTTNVAAVPNYHGCLTPLAQSFAYCNLNNTNEERAMALVGLLTLE
jgi:hypothetical protein